MTTSESLPPKQLSMTISADRARLMPAAPLPSGYELRPYRAGDEDSWIELINTGEFDAAWDSARFDEYIAGPERTEGSRVVVKEGEILAATFASVHAEPPYPGRVDFVVSRPEIRGLGLGRAVCVEVVRYLVGKGYSEIILFTDDWRLPAIGLYLSMGFEPQMTREDMPARWANIRAELESRASGSAEFERRAGSSQ